MLKKIINKIMPKIKLLIVFLFLVLIIVFLSLCSTFYFNKLEFQGKSIYSSIETAKKAAFDNIEQRSGREGGSKSNEEYEYYSGLVTDNLNKMDSLISDHQNILDKQGKILFLLTPKYKKYYGLKKEAFEKYYLSLRDFKKLKESETVFYYVLTKQNDFSVLMTDISKKKEIKIDSLKKLIKDLESLQIDIKKQFNNGLLTEKFNNQVTDKLKYFIGCSNLVLDWQEGKISIDDFGEKLSKLINEDKNRSYDIVGIIDESRTKITNVKAEEWRDLYDTSIELSNKASDYYYINKLYDDKLSKILSIRDKNYPQNKEVKSNAEVEEKYIDLNGDGQQEVIRLTSKYIDEENSEVSLIAYDKNNKEIGRLPDAFPINIPLSDSARVYTPIKKDKKQFVSFEFVVGPHSSDTMFFGLFNFKDGNMGILPVCLTKDVESASDCLFWSGEVGDLWADDYDKDGILEIVEMVDEYPKDGQLTEEVKNSTTKIFNELGTKAGDGALRILRREQGGRGNKVIWAIYKYGDKYFEEQLGKDYDKYYVLAKDQINNLLPKYPTIMKKSEMSKDSLEYNEFFRNYWKGKI